MKKYLNYFGDTIIFFCFAVNSILITDMRRLTNKEKEIMERFWAYGPMFIRELQEKYTNPQPNFNTLSTQVHTLHVDGFLDRKAYGSNYQYFAAVSREEYSFDGLHGMVNEFFGSSYSNVVIGLIKEEKLSVDDLKRIIEKIEKG